MPIKRVPTAMFSLVRIRPMCEQEAPKWPWELFNDADLNTIHVGSQRGLSYDSNMIKENSPMSSALCQSSGYRQLCSLWFEYDLCLNRKPPGDHKSCLMTLIRIWSENRPKGVKLRFEYDHIAPSGFGVADQEGTDSYVLFGSNTTYVWTESPQMTLRLF